MSLILNIDKASKNYGKINALNNLSLQINKGEIYGILGPNGSGKTTTLGIILGVLILDSGSYTWFGKPPHKDHRKKIGSLIETPNFYPYLTAQQNLELTCKVKEVNPIDIARVLDVVGLTKRASSKFKTFSLGMKQRLALGAALLGNPEILVLDEPTNGLDPQGIVEVRTIIKKLATEGKTIIMASHILDEVEKICSHVAVLKSGNLLTFGNIQDVLNTKEQHYASAEDLGLLKITLNQIDGVSDINQVGKRIYFSLKDEKDSSYLNKNLFEKGIIISELGIKKPGLEENFLALIK